ncbi:hypothetical protein AVDCRST_MAG84-3062 [uncultured Microcoleus sp.]|uniref:Uncharacterized protein n=1 Tax=uncultured Microcoleus sp. TaxID=259945 RepID=A0A6J4MC59_9CYAN|nr:hypothetical protein AVDCRST_MAG84-3062 [uncultured Microcoleus sp.]
MRTGWRAFEGDKRSDYLAIALQGPFSLFLLTSDFSDKHHKFKRSKSLPIQVSVTDF